MKRFAFAAAALTLALATPTLADVTVKASGSGGAFGVSSGAVTTTYTKGNKMRSETVVGGTTHTTILDVDAQRMYSFDSKKKQVDAWDMKELSAAIGSTVDTAAMKASVKPNGQTKQINGKTATGYDMQISVPASMGGQGGMAMTVTLSGPIWIVQGAPGTADYTNFYKAAAAKGFIFSDPKTAKAQPGNAKAITEMYKRFAATGGIPHETNMTIRIGADGPLGGLMDSMGKITSTSTVTSVDTAALPARLFTPPAGYKIKEQRAVGVGR